MAPTDAELIERARALAPVIRARSAETEVRRKVHDETLEALAEAGILQMLVPRRWGGSEARLDTMRQVVSTISAACVSTGWIASFYISHNVYVARFNEQAQREVYGERGYTLMPSATAPKLEAQRVDGGWIVSGRAIWGSGIMHADWVQISGMIADGLRTFLIPIKDVKVADNWHYTGASGTGSNDFTVDEVFVPEYLSEDLIAFNNGDTDAGRAHENLLYRAPFILVAYCTIAPVVTGGLEGALAEYQAMVTGRVRNFSGAVVKDMQHAHISLGEAGIRTAVAGELCASTFAHADRIVSTEGFTYEERIAMKGRVSYLANHCRETVNAMMGSAGASSYHLTQPLQRFWRDLNMISAHAFWDWDSSRETVGRKMLDLPLRNPLV